MPTLSSASEDSPQEFARLNSSFANLVIRDYLQHTPGYEATLSAFRSDSAALASGSPSSAGHDHEDDKIDAWYKISELLKLPDLLLRHGAPALDGDEGGSSSIVEVRLAASTSARVVVHLWYHAAQVGVSFGPLRAPAH